FHILYIYTVYSNFVASKGPKLVLKTFSLGVELF
ncbi:MAG: hypothetical protein RLZZ586_970, partial [Pseudomonadota bacterium]